MMLKLCPFCGGEAKIETESYGGSAGKVSTIYCVECGVTKGDLYGPVKDAVKAWNTRTNLCQNLKEK